MSETKTITILIVDDHAIVRQGLRALFTIQPDCRVIGEASSGEDAVTLAAELVPDIILMDLIMPGIGGVETTRRIKDVSPSSQVIILTSFHDDEHIFPALRAGALSYALKDIEPSQLVETVRKAILGESIMHPRVAARVVQEIRTTQPATWDPFAALSERELEVLRLIAGGLTNAEIAEHLFISEKTVKGHVSNILGKLHMLDRTKAAVFAWEQGLVSRETE
ncbi:response regulator transcription factor [Paenibacillus lautus]|uniref:response regulator transcription factor n=1 Tax=Paenibacillus lautus TaxID=1401 RepID=UPI002DBB34B3|nr:response regulator transcription factor [Paenibacillus lautus]MEC0253848.1 response regulator transcription factor [Paenibacillus lautus]